MDSVVHTYIHSWPHVYSVFRLAQNSTWAGHCFCWEVSLLSRVCKFTVQVVAAVFYILSDDTSNMSYYTGGFRRKLPFFGKTFLILIWIYITVLTYTCLTSCFIRTVCNHSTSDIEFTERSLELRRISHEAFCIASVVGWVVNAGGRRISLPAILLTSGFPCISSALKRNSGVILQPTCFCWWKLSLWVHKSLINWEM